MEFEGDEVEGGAEAIGDEVSRRIRWGGGGVAAAVALLFFATPLSLWEVIGIPLFYLLLPTLAVAQLPLVRSEKLERLPVYLGSAATILLIGAIGLLLGFRLVGGEGLGLVWLPAGEFVLWTLGLTAAGLGVIGFFLPADRVLSGDGARVLAELLPRTGREKGAFVGLSAAAGVGEELAYRGYALVAIQLLGAGPWAAAGASSAAFGFLHSYQGPVGVIRTGVMGFILAVPVLLTGSLLPSIAAHTLIDLIAGLVLGPRLVPSLEGASEAEALVPPPSME